MDLNVKEFNLTLTQKEVDILEQELFNLIPKIYPGKKMDWEYFLPKFKEDYPLLDSIYHLIGKNIKGD